MTLPARKFLSLSVGLAQQRGYTALRFRAVQVFSVLIFPVLLLFCLMVLQAAQLLDWTFLFWSVILSLLLSEATILLMALRIEDELLS